MISLIESTQLKRIYFRWSNLFVSIYEKFNEIIERIKINFRDITVNSYDCLVKLLLIFI